MTKHRLTGTPEHVAWVHAKQRCNNPNNSDYQNYGARGITMAPEWESNFTAFLAEVGPRPTPAHSLDRIECNRGYEPGNVRWATLDEQAANRRWCLLVEWQGRKVTPAELARETGVPYMTLKKRLERGLTPEVAVKAMVPRKGSAMVTHNGVTRTVPEWAMALGLRRRTLAERLRRGMALDQALTPALMRSPQT